MPVAFVMRRTVGGVLEQNLLAAIDGRELDPGFDGHANCFIETGFGKALLIDFNYDTEPLPADHPLRTLPNTVLTGHTGYVMLENYRLSYSEAVEDIKGWLAGEPVRVLNGVS